MINDFVKTSKMQQRALRFMISNITRRTSCDDYDVPTTMKHVFPQPVTLPDQPGQMMSYNTVSDLLTDGYSNTVSLCMIFQNIHHQKSICVRLSLSVYILEIPILLQRFWKFHSSMPFRNSAFPSALRHYLIKKEKTTKLWPKLIISFYLLIFLQPILFFRLRYSFCFWSRELWLSVSSSAEMSSSYGIHLLCESFTAPSEKNGGIETS